MFLFLTAFLAAETTPGLAVFLSRPTPGLFLALPGITDPCTVPTVFSPDLGGVLLAVLT